MENKNYLEADRILTEAETLEEGGDLEGAFKCLLAGAEAGHTSCQVNLGSFYSDAKGTERDFKRAAYWYKQAYKNGDRTGALNLAIDLRNSGRQRTAVLWFKKAIAMNDGSACIELAKMYLARKTNKLAAVALLKQTLQMHLYEVSEDEKEEAAVLLAQLTNQRPLARAAR